MAYPSNYTSSSAYSSSSAYTNTSDNQSGSETNQRKDIPEQNRTGSNSHQTSQHVITPKGVKIPRLALRSSPQASDNAPVSPTRGTPGQKPQLLPGMPGLPLSPATSPRQATSTRASETPSSPTSPRRQLPGQPTPRRLPTERNLKIEVTPADATGTSPRPVPGSPSTISTSNSNITKTDDDVDTSALLKLLEETDLSTDAPRSKPTVDRESERSQPATSSDMSANPAANPLPNPAAGGLQVVRIRARVNSRALAEGLSAPVTPRSAEWSRTRPATSERTMRSPRANATARQKQVADAAKLYSKATLSLLKEGKPETIKSLGRKDPEIAAADMPDSLKPFYLSKTLKSFPVAPLLRQLFKKDMESTGPWQEAEKLTRQAIVLCDASIPFGVNRAVKEREMTKFKPLADQVIVDLFPATGNISDKAESDPIRALHGSFLTNDFVQQLLMTVDAEVIERCATDESLSVKEINDIRYTVFFDLIFTRVVMPMISRLFPEFPNQSQTWLLSALGDSLKNVMPHLGKDFFEQSRKFMPESHRTFLEKKAKQEEEDAVKKNEKIREQRIAALKGQSIAGKSQKYYDKIADQKRQRDNNKKNAALYDQLIEWLNVEWLDNRMASLIEKEISKKLREYDGVKPVDHIRNDLLSILKKIPSNELTEEISVIITNLAAEVKKDTDSRIQRMTVAFDASLLQGLIDDPTIRSSAFGDDTFIDFAMIETFTADEISEAATRLTTTTSTAPSSAVTTTTTTMTANSMPSTVNATTTTAETISGSAVDTDSAVSIPWSDTQKNT